MMTDCLEGSCFFLNAYHELGPESLQVKLDKIGFAPRVGLLMVTPIAHSGLLLLLELVQLPRQFLYLGCRHAQLLLLLVEQGPDGRQIRG